MYKKEEEENKYMYLSFFRIIQANINSNAQARSAQAFKTIVKSKYYYLFVQEKRNRPNQLHIP